MSHHHGCGHAASRADGREPWHARKPLGSSVWATGGTLLSANVELTASAGQGADALLIWVGWPFGPGHCFRGAASLEHSTKERPQRRLRRRGRGFGNGPENLMSPWLEGVEDQGCVGDRYRVPQEPAFHFCGVSPRRTSRPNTGRPPCSSFLPWGSAFTLNLSSSALPGATDTGRWHGSSLPSIGTEDWQR